MSYSGLSWLRMGLSGLGTAMVLPLCAIGMEASWLFLWVIVLGQWLPHPAQATIVSPGSAFLLVLASAAATWRLLRSRWTLLRLRLALLALGVAAALLAAAIEQPGGSGWLGPIWLLRPLLELGNVLGHPSPAQATAGVALLLWWRGIGLGGSSFARSAIEDRFWTGAAAGLVALLVLAFAGNGGPDPTAYTLLFFFCGLAALSLAHLQQVRAQRGAPGQTIRARRHWLLATFGTILGVLLLAMLAAQVLAFDVLSWLARPVATALDWLDLVLYVVLLPLGLLVEVLVWLLRWLLGGAREAPPLQLPEQPNPQGLREVAGAAVPAEVVLVLKWLIVLALAAAALLLLARAVARVARPATDDDVEEERESIWSWAALIDALRSWLRQWRPRRRRPAAAAAGAVVRASDRAGLSMAAISVREIYRALLRLGLRRGLPRRAAETPYEYLGRLGPALPADEQHLGTITAAYVQARYADDEPSEEAVAAARAAWRAVLEREGSPNG